MLLYLNKQPAIFYSLQIPLYGPTGINGGIMLMNLTRINDREEDWVETMVDIYEKYKQHIALADQDILNVFFSEVR